MLPHGLTYPEAAAANIGPSENSLGLYFQSAGGWSNSGVQIVERDTDEFWVDLYIDPHTVPTAVNQTWETVGTQGVAWGVLADALPLYPGESLTLTLSSPYYTADSSHVIWPLAANAQLYAQVDSNNPGNSSGAVREYHEINGDPYNNI